MALRKLILSSSCTQVDGGERQAAKESERDGGGQEGWLNHPFLPSHVNINCHLRSWLLSVKSSLFLCFRTSSSHIFCGNSNAWSIIWSSVNFPVLSWIGLHYRALKTPPCCEWCPRIFQPNLKSNKHSQLHTNNSLTPNTLEKMQRKDEKFNLNTNIAEIHSVHLTLNCGSHSFWPFFAYVFLNSSHTLCILYSLVLCKLSL